MRYHPGRIEIVQIQGEDPECGLLMFYREIIRPAGKKPYLGPLVSIRDEAGADAKSPLEIEGRMIGLLPVQGARQ